MGENTLKLFRLRIRKELVYMMTKKQKKEKIPLLEKEITELRNDLLLVNSERAKKLIEKEIDNLNDSISKYKFDIEQPNNRRR